MSNYTLHQMSLYRIYDIIIHIKSAINYIFFIKFNMQFLF